MKLLIVTDSLFVNSAYALQTKILASRLKRDGHKVMVFGSTYRGKPVGVPVKDIPAVVDPKHTDSESVFMFGNYATSGYGEEIWDEVANSFDADFIFTFKDPFVYSLPLLHSLQHSWVALAPVDTDPASELVVGSIEAAADVITISKHGEKSLNAQGVDALYCPLGFEASSFYPGDKKAARDKLGIDAELFLALFVGANNSTPPRKGVDQLMLAFSEFSARYEDAVLYLHTDMTHPTGPNLLMWAKQLGFSERNLITTDQAQVKSDLLDVNFLRTLYQAADVLCIPSTGEGFCVPAVEAQACGTPVIATGFTALDETVASGWKINWQPDGATGMLELSPSGGFRYRAHVNAIFAALQEARVKRDHPDWKQSAIEHAKQYEWDTVYENYWKPVLEGIHAGLTEGLL